MAVHQGPTPKEDYGLDAVAQHNAEYSHLSDDAKGLGIYHDDYAPAYQEDSQYVHNPPTPRSNTDDGVRTRSGRSTRRTDSPFSSKSRVSKSPAPKPKRDRKSKLDKTKTPKLTAPLSVLTQDMNVPIRDMNAWVNRSAEERKQEVEKRNGYVTRPMNSFMLYRSAYAERTKVWCLQNNHQVVSSVSGESWPMEPQEVRDQFNEWAKIERANHQAAHPEYKFSPSKTSAKRRRDEFSDDEQEPSDLGDPDAEYRGPRSANKRRAIPRDGTYLPADGGFVNGVHPYYGHHGVYGSPEYLPVQSIGRPPPSSMAYDEYGRPYSAQTHHYVQQPSHHFSLSTESHGAPRVPTPASATGNSTLGGFGMPGSSHSDELFGTSRQSTPMQHYDAYGRPIFFQPHFHQASFQQGYLPAVSYEQQHFLPTQALPTSLDPQLEAVLADVNAAAHAHAHSQESHFENAFAGGSSSSAMGMQEYYDQNTSPNATLAPQWSPLDEMRKGF